MNHKWNYRPITPEQAETSQTLAQELGISPILGQLLVQRGITKAADAKKFFRPQLPDLHDPFLMNDMDIAGRAIAGGKTSWRQPPSLFPAVPKVVQVSG